MAIIGLTVAAVVLGWGGKQGLGNGNGGNAKASQTGGDDGYCVRWGDGNVSGDCEVR